MHHAYSVKTMNIETTCNTPDSILFKNVLINSQRKVKWLKQEQANEGHAVIVGGGPSVADWIEEIRMRKNAGQTIFALNAAAKWLKTQCIEPDYCVVVDARDINIGFVNNANTDLLASQCHPSLFEESKNAILWHQEYPDNMADFEACLPEDQPEHALIGGGTTVGLSALVVAYAMGFRFLHLYGYDSSFRNEAAHAYQQQDPQRIDCVATVAGKSFNTTLAMAKQAELFPKLSDSLIDLGCTITIRGDGLLPWTSKMSAVKPEEMTEQEKYLKMWEIPAYRNFSPGENAASFFCLAANPKPNDLVIDFGTGTGRGALRIHEMRRCNVLMLDFADNCLDEQVRSKIGNKIVFAKADLTKPIEHRAPYGYCTDVMEHIEPDKVDAVLVNIMTAAPKVFFQICTVPDTMGALIGQDLHLTVQPAEWWKSKFESLGYAVQWEFVEDTAVMFFVTQPLEEENA